MNAAIYARKSNLEGTSDADAKSVTRQIENARIYAMRKGWTVDEEHIYSDDGISGAEFVKRPGLVRLLAALDNKPPSFGALVMSEESRIGREQIETSYVLKQLTDAGVRVFLYLEDRERTLDNATSKVMLSLTNFGAELEREKAGQRTKDALLKRIRDGYAVGAPGFGYRLVADGDRKRRVIDDGQAVIVRQIFEHLADGKGFLRLAHYLNATAVPAPTSKGWSPNGLKALAHNEVYRGRLIYGQTMNTFRNGRAKKIDVPESEWITFDRPELRIVTDALWSATHARLTAARENYLRTNDGRLQGKPDHGLESKYFLSGFLRCGVCQGRLVAIESGRSYACATAYRRGRDQCAASKRIAREKLDRVILDVVDKVILNPDNVAKIVQLMIDRNGETPDREQEHSVMMAEVTRIEGELGRLTDVIARGLSDSPSILAAIHTKEGQLGAARARLEHLDGLARAGDRWQDPQWLSALRTAVEERRARLSGSPDRVAPLSVAVTRQLLRKSVEAIVISPGTEGENFSIDVRFGDIFQQASMLTIGRSEEREG